MCDIPIGHHIAKLLRITGGTGGRGRFRADGLLTELGTCHPVEKYPVGIEGIPHPGAVQLSRRHDGGDRGIHLQCVPQFRPSEIHRHQWKTGGSVAAHPHGQHVEGLGNSNLSGGQARPQHSVRRDRHSRLVLPAHRLVHGLCSIQKSVSHQLSQGIALLNAGPGSGEAKTRNRQYLVVGKAISLQIRLTHLFFPPFHQRCDGGILRPGLVDGNKAVILQGLAAALAPAQGDGTQIPAVRPCGDNIGPIYHDGLAQGGMGMAGDDEVNSIHSSGQLIILSPALKRTGVG